MNAYNTLSIFLAYDLEEKLCQSASSPQIASPERTPTPTPLVVQETLAELRKIRQSIKTAIAKKKKEAAARAAAVAGSGVPAPSGQLIVARIGSAGRCTGTGVITLPVADTGNTEHDGIFSRLGNPFFGAFY